MIPALLLALALVHITAADDVVVGTGKNFEDLIKKNDFVVAEFYAPWCGHCKNLEPEYAKAATELKANDPPIVLVKVDATEDGNKELASKYEIQGFPTIKIFRGNKLDEPQEYKGPRQSAGIVEYLKKKTRPASSLLNDKTEVETFKQGDPVVLGVFKSVPSSESDIFLSVASKLSDDLSFAHVTSAELHDKKVKAPAVVLLKKSEGKELTYDGPFEASKFQQWVETRSAPLLIGLDDKPRHREAAQKAFGSDLPKFFSVFEKDSAVTKTLIPALNKLAETLLGEVFFINIDPANQQALDFFGLKKEETPAFIVQNAKDKYILKNAGAKQLPTFWKDFKAGKLEKSIKSEEPPADNTKPVTIVTGKTLDKLAFSGKTVLLEFYAPWCGHCKKLEPVYEQVGKEFAADDGVIIGKMDATANDITSDKFEVSGFPALYLVNSSGDVVQYSGDRSAKDLIKFVKENHAGSPPASSGAHTEL